jgi:hypothetical protein
MACWESVKLLQRYGDYEDIIFYFVTFFINCFVLVLAMMFKNDLELLIAGQI